MRCTWLVATRARAARVARGGAKASEDTRDEGALRLLGELLAVLEDGAIRVQLRVQNPTLVVERITQFVEEVKSECIPSLEYFVAVHITPEAKGILISLERVQATIGEGAHQLFVGKGLQQRPVLRKRFVLWCPPDVEETCE